MNKVIQMSYLLIRYRPIMVRRPFSSSPFMAIPRRPIRPNQVQNLSKERAEDKVVVFLSLLAKQREEDKAERAKQREEDKAEQSKQREEDKAERAKYIAKSDKINLKGYRVNLLSKLSFLIFGFLILINRSN